MIVLEMENVEKETSVHATMVLLEKIVPHLYVKRIVREKENVLVQINVLVMMDTKGMTVPK